MTITLSEVTLDDQPWIDEYFEYLGFRGWYNCFPVMYYQYNSTGFTCFTDDRECLYVMSGKRKFNIIMLYEFNDERRKELKEIPGWKSTGVRHLPEQLDGITMRKEKEFIFPLEEMIDDFDKPEWKKLRYSVNYVERIYPELKIETFGEKHIKDYPRFIDKWIADRQIKNVFRDREMKILECLDLLDGIAITHDSKLVGCQFNYPLPGDKETVCFVLGKTDTDYKRLFSYLTYIASDRARGKGYKWANDSSAYTANLGRYKETLLGKTGTYYINWWKDKLETINQPMEGWRW